MYRIAAVCAAMTLGATVLAAPATAEPMPPCEFGLAFLCSMLPVAPELEHDIELTSEVPPANSLPENQMADPCAGGCI